MKHVPYAAPVRRRFQRELIPLVLAAACVVWAVCIDTCSMPPPPPPVQTETLEFEDDPYCRSLRQQAFIEHYNRLNPP